MSFWRGGWLGCVDDSGGGEAPSDTGILALLLAGERWGRGSGRLKAVEDGRFDRCWSLVL